MGPDVDRLNSITGNPGTQRSIPLCYYIKDDFFEVCFAWKGLGHGYTLQKKDVFDYG
jgi:hypothetical protein